MMTLKNIYLFFLFKNNVFIFKLKDNCFTEFCWFLRNIIINNNNMST